MDKTYNNHVFHSELEKSLFESVDSKTPEYIKENKLVDLANKELILKLTTLNQILKD